MEECTALLKQHSVRYLGQQFPETDEEQADFALVRIFDEESDEDWPVGYYRLDADITQIDQALQALRPASQSHWMAGWIRR